MIVLQTPRLRLEHIELNDASFLLELLNSPGWLRFIGDRNVRTMPEAREYAKKMRLQYEESDYGFNKVVIKETNETIGTCGLLKRPHLEHVDIGFALLPAFHRKGYAMEAAKKTLDFALNDLKVNPICAVTNKDNFASQKLLEKLGLNKVGTTTWDNGDELLLYLIDVSGR